MKTAKHHFRWKKCRSDRLILHTHYAVQLATIPKSQLLRRWARAAMQPQTRRSAEVSLRVVDTEEGRCMNRDYRGKDYATNVLTFALHEGEGYREQQPLFGDIILTAPVIEAEADELGLLLEAHYAHLVIHGMLHLQGYNHEEDDEADSMEALETVILQRLGYADPYRKERA